MSGQQRTYVVELFFEGPAAESGCGGVEGVGGGHDGVAGALGFGFGAGAWGGGVGWVVREGGFGGGWFGHGCREW